MKIKVIGDKSKRHNTLSYNLFLELQGVGMFLVDVLGFYTGVLKSGASLCTLHLHLKYLHTISQLVRLHLE